MNSIAYIHENQCIGCVKCINVCPVDAIVGSQNQLHTVIADECIGCDLCVPACPMDCIDMVALKTANDKDERLARAKQAKLRVNNRKQRLQQQQFAKPIEDKQSMIAAVLARAKAKRGES
tara:strand:+ start:40268 stop:40627 length:360 start_codon:yes stop_codon:yes gene_type:complete